MSAIDFLLGVGLGVGVEVGGGGGGSLSKCRPVVELKHYQPHRGGSKVFYISPYPETTPFLLPFLHIPLWLR